MLEFSKHQNKTPREKVEVYRTSTIIFWVLCGVMIAALIICAIFTKVTLDKFSEQSQNRDFIIFLVTLVCLVISSIGFVAFLSFGINFTILYTHYKKTAAQERKTN